MIYDPLYKQIEQCRTKLVAGARVALYQMHLSPSDAEDAVQDAIMAFLRWNQWEGRASLYTCLWKAVQWSVRMRLRSSKPRGVLIPPLTRPRCALQREVRAAVEKLPDVSREIAWRVLGLQESTYAVAREMGISQATVVRRVQKAKKLLRHALRTTTMDYRDSYEVARNRGNREPVRFPRDNEPLPPSDVTVTDATGNVLRIIPRPSEEMGGNVKPMASTHCPETRRLR